MELNIYKTRERVIITIVIGYKDMQQRVLDESSQVAVRELDNEGVSHPDMFVLDEGNESRFRSYFYSAQGDLEEYLSAYTKNMPAVSDYIETNKADVNDCIIRLPMPHGFNESLSKAIGFKIEDFVEAYIMYKWLEMKLPNKAGGYLSVSDKLKREINANLNKRSGSIERPNVYYGRI